MSLFVKYAPKTFNELVGQNNARNILEHDVKTKELTNYLFCGCYGCGKTSSVYILANELNAYLSIIDASQMNHAEDIQNIIDTIYLKPIGYDYRIICLDEAQNLFYRKDSLAAQKLLTTLENHPDFVIFILCTTEPQKIIDTIKSRCKTIVYNPIDKKIIVDRLEYICKSEKKQYEKQALDFVAEQSNGSLRQAISNLEALISLGQVTLGNATKLLSSRYDDLLDILDAVKNKDIGTIVEIVHQQENIQNFVKSLFSFVLGVCVYSKTHNINLTGIPSVLESDIKNYEEICGIELETFLNLQSGANVDILGDLLVASLYLDMHK